MPPLYPGIRPYILLISVAGSTSEVNAAIQQNRGILPVTDAKSLRSGEAGQCDLARRRLPRLRMSFSPAKCPPVSSRIERRPTIMAKAWSHKNRSGIDGRHRRLSDLFLLLAQEPRQLRGLGLAYRKPSEAKPRAWRGFNISV